MTNERLEELAALHALNLLDETGRQELLAAAERDPAVNDLIREFAETAALMAYAAPEVVPPAGLKQDLMRRLPARGSASKVSRFPQLIAYAIAACLMALGIIQAIQVMHLKARIQDLKSTLVTEDSEIDQLRQSNQLKDLRLAVLEKASAAQTNSAFAGSHILVAWDPTHDRGVISMQSLPAPPPGHDYQLWVLDPKAAAPISAGLITDSRAFAAARPSTSNPGFAISLEPQGGSPTPTGPILFAATASQ
jgi:anti-sigma-K factor RskA